jgi:cytochrome c oxidase accessory protein FixG
VKSIVLGMVLFVVVLLPWLRWARGTGQPDQAILFDFHAARAYVFGLGFGPQDLILMLALLLAAAFVLFFTNVLVGRVWCGFTCPQTLWTDLFVMVERRLAPLGLEAPFWRRGLKQSIWVAISVLTGLTLVSYFTDARHLWSGFFAGRAGMTATIFVLIFAGVTYLLAGHARELVCLHMCPWPRFQSAMTDARTLLVTYDAGRGEPRGPLKRAATGGGETGDCVDCNLCVAVCPTGIDIRDGSQLGCIGCGLCVDACNGVMTRIGRAPQLIGFLAEPVTVAKPTIRWRALGFGALALAAIAVLASHLANREALAFSITPERQPPFIRLSDGSIRNAYTLRLRDHGQRERGLVFRVVTPAGARLALATDPRGESLGEIALPAGIRGKDLSERLTITIPADQATAGRSPMRLLLLDTGTGETLSEAESYFWAPEAGSRP